MRTVVPAPVTHTFSVPATASATTESAAFTLDSPNDYLVVIATLTGMSAGTLDMYIQESWDGGTTFYDVAHFTQLAGGASAITYRVVTAHVGGAKTIGSGTTPVLSAGSFADGPWGPTLRLVSVVGTGSNSGAVVQTVTFIPWTQSH